MRTLGKIAIVTALIAFISSCQKEKLPTPGSSQQNFYSSDRHSAPSSLKHEGEENSDGNEIVGGGDGDRDGGSNQRKLHIHPAQGSDSGSSVDLNGKDSANSGPGEIVGGGDGDRDGGSGGPTTGKKGG